MNVLAISSSPRKGGNSDVLCDEFLKGAAASGHAVQKLRLAEKKISPCAACYGCAESHVCVRKDDMAEVLEALKAADVIVLASPVYFYSVCAQMKTMIDRCLASYQAIRNKTFYLIVTAADPQHNAADETLADSVNFDLSGNVAKVMQDLSTAKDLSTITWTIAPGLAS